jgi:hypothetical protein
MNAGTIRPLDDLSAKHGPALHRWALGRQVPENPLLPAHHHRCGTDYMTDTTVADFLTIPPGPRPPLLRWAEVLWIEQGWIVQSQVLLDFVDWFSLLSRPVLPRPKGVPFVYPAGTPMMAFCWPCRTTPHRKSPSPSPALLSTAG